jgi:UDP-N-acetylglucosamine transferase subunit ALG13
LNTRVLVSVGTHEQPFDYLLNMVAQLSRDGSPYVFRVQFGVGRWDGDAETAFDYGTPSEMRDHLRWADLLVSQASPGNIYGALDAGVWPIVIGRRHARGEHVDDHQAVFAEFAQEMGLCTAFEDLSDLRTALDDARDGAADSTSTDRAVAAAKLSAQRTGDFRRTFWEISGVPLA